jgi:hypothetical protein
MGWLRGPVYEFDGWAYCGKAEALLPHSIEARFGRRALHALMHFDLKREAFVE